MKGQRKAPKSEAVRIVCVFADFGYEAALPAPTGAGDNWGPPPAEGFGAATGFEAATGAYGGQQTNRPVQQRRDCCGTGYILLEGGGSSSSGAAA